MRAQSQGGSPELPTGEQIRGRLAAVLAPEVLAHVDRTAQVARSLAVEHGVDPHRAEIAALLHDVADSLPDDELLKRAAAYGIAISPTETHVPRLLHGPVGAELLREEWGITDEEILDAVRYHITGAPIMSPLVKIVFVADKIEPARDLEYGGLSMIRAAAKTDLDEAVLRLYGWRLGRLVEADQPVAEPLVAARNAIIERNLAMYR